MIWTDKTSVCLGVRRGKVRVWRTPEEEYNPTEIRRRFAKYLEFMFWGLFLWYRKGPCHIWKKETATEKKASEKELKDPNALREPDAKEEWEINTAMKRAKL